MDEMKCRQVEAGVKLGNHSRPVKPRPATMFSQAIPISPSLPLHLQSNMASATSQETTSKLGFQRSDLLVCPKPRHLASAIPEFLKPLSQLNTDTDERREVLNLTTEKAVDGRDSPFTIYAGSPPGRTENPLIHDVRFIRQMEVFSPFTRTKLSDKFGVTSASPF